MSEWFAIFYWDGVVVDSSKLHETAWHRLGEEEKRSMPPGFFLRSFGMRNQNVIPELLGWTHDPLEIDQLSLRKEEIFRELVHGSHLVPLPGVVGCLEKLKTAGVPCAVASSTPRENINCVIDVLEVGPFFKALVCAEDVTRGKPDPEVFLRAAGKLAAPPERCVVFEDAHVGIEAGRRAGMRVVGVATTHPAASLKGADRDVSRLDELQLDELRHWFGSKN